ncbi:hypothetical protein FEDK69T_19400 [Flavobacterium enshiense DK69]|nr:T9SS type A sorting domain-containing protein [Flavobacterium enshiense]ESU22682.1 hypothetical protein FEDK69T_19400 [Flavobacterium enshiense DK69]
MQKKLRLGKVFDCFGLKKENRLLHGTVVALSLFCFSNSSFAQQTTIINPAEEGGFEKPGNTFAANGWTVANEGTGPIKWALGTAASGTTSVGAITSGSTAVTLTAANANIVQGQVVYGDNIPANTFVAAISGTSLTLSQGATATSGTVTLGFGKTSGGGISVATSQITTASITANTYSVTLAAANPNISVGMLIAPVTGFIGADTYVASINGTALGLSKASINSGALSVAQTLSFSATGSGISGNAAYITNDNGATNSYGGYTGTRTVYFYRDITNVPVAQKAMTLTFDVKSAPASGSGWQVWVAPIAQTVTGTNTQVTVPMTYGVSWPGATLISFNSGAQVATTKNTAFIPKSFAGTPFRLIFVWTNNATAGTVPPAAIDNISLVSRIPEEINCAHSGLWSQPGTWEGGNVPTPADTAVLNDDGEVVMVDSRYSGAETLFFSGTNTLLQFAQSSVMDEFNVAQDLTLSAGGSRFNNHDGSNGKNLKLGHNLDVSAQARFDSNVGGSTAGQGCLTLNGSTLQTVTVATGGLVGGSATGVNGTANVAGVLNQLEVNNTFAGTSNVSWKADGVRIKSRITLTNGRVSVFTGNRLILGNFSSLSNIFVNPGSGFVSGTVSKVIGNANQRVVQPGTEYPGTDGSYKPTWYPFISGAGLDRSLYLLPDTSPTTFGEMAVTYADANTVSNVTVTEGAYTINKRYDGNWSFSTPDGNVVPGGNAFNLTAGVTGSDTTATGMGATTTAITLAAANANILVGQLVSGLNIAPNTYVSAISGANLTLSQATTNASAITVPVRLNFIAASLTTATGMPATSTVVTLAAANPNIIVGQVVSGPNVAPNTYVAAISGTTLTLSQATTNTSDISAAVTLSFTPTYRVGLYANGGLPVIDGTSRLMNATAVMPGIHQDGTATPFAFRKGLTIANLTSDAVYIGASNTSFANAATTIVSATSGNWSTGSTWVGGVAPSCNSLVTIASGHNVTVTTAANAAGVTISKGGTLTNNAGTTTMTVGVCTNDNNNAAFFNYGSHVMIAGTLKVNGFVAHKNGSFFSQTGGDIVIDSNNNGNVASSVAFGGASCKIETSNLDLTGGKITIVDPLVNIGTPVAGQSAANFSVNTAGATGTYIAPGGTNGTTLSEIRINGTFSNNIFDAGMSISGPNIPANTTITNVVPGTNHILTLSQPVTASITPTTSQNGSITTGSANVTLSAANTNIYVGASVSGTGIPANTFVQSIAGTNLVLSQNATATNAALSLGFQTNLTFSSMANDISGVVVEQSAANQNLAIGMGISGTGIPANTTITAITPLSSGAGVTGAVVRLGLSNQVTGLAPSPIVSQLPLAITVVTPGATSVVLSAANGNIQPGMTVSGQGIKPGTFVTSVSGANVSLSEPIQAGAPAPMNIEFQSFNTQFSGSFIYASPNHYAAGLNHTLQIGDGVSTQNTSSITNGFNCQFQAGGGLFSLGNLTVDAPQGASRFMNVGSNNANGAYNMNVQNAFTVTAGSVFKKTFANSTIYVGGNIVNNGTINSASGGTQWYLGNYINGAAVATSLPQTISGSGTFLSSEWALNPGLPTLSVPQLVVNNASTAGVTISVPNFRTNSVTLTSGIVHTSAAYPIYVGNPNVTSSSFTSGTFSGGSATSYIDGPAVHANSSNATLTLFKLFPVGKNGKYLPILIASTGGVELMAEAFDTNSGNETSANLSNLSANRWKVTRVGSAGAFTGYNVRLAPSSPVVTASNIIVHSATENGTYDIVSNPASAITFDAAHFSIPAYPSIVLATPQVGGFLGNFSYTEGPACTGTPTPGATVASSSSVCAGQSVALSLATPTTGALVTYQWQSSVNAGPMTNIAGATAATYTATPAVNTSYQCIVTCTGNSGTSTPVAVTVTASTATTTGSTMCTGGTANLSASGSAILNWYDAPTGGNMVAQGVGYSPTVSQTTTYYVASGSESTGSANTAAFGGTGVSSANFKGISFDAVNNLKLKTVTVYPKNTASLTPITVGLFDANGNVVAGTSPVTFTPTLVTGTVGTTSQVVTLNYTIPVGKDYRLVATNGLVATNNTLGNSNATIAYPLTVGPLKLTGNVSALNDVIVTTGGNTNIFHNLTYDEVCEGIRVPVTATVVNTTAPTAAATQDACATRTIADFVVTPTAGATLTWYDAPAAGNIIQTSTPAVLGTTYYVSQTVTINSVSCEGPRFGITAGGPCLGTADFKIAELKYYPNPVNDQLTITAKDVITRIEVYNLLGQQLNALDNTTNNVQMNFGGFASSTYLVKVYSEDHVDFFKVIKRD